MTMKRVVTTGTCHLQEKGLSNDQPTMMRWVVELTLETQESTEALMGTTHGNIQEISFPIRAGKTDN